MTKTELVFLAFRYFPYFCPCFILFMEYLIEIKETLSKQLRVEADSAEEAICQVKKQYRDSEIVLTADDFVDYKIDTINDSDFRKINCK